MWEEVFLPGGEFGAEAEGRDTPISLSSSFLGVVGVFF